MALGWWASNNADILNLMPAKYDFAAPIFAFGLIAFGFLGMGPVTIAVDSFGPVTDNAQSVFELSQIEKIPNIREEVKRDFGFEPSFENAKHLLEKGDGAGNTFKATAKPVLIGTAVVGATTMVFGIILMLDKLYGDVISKLSSISMKSLKEKEFSDKLAALGAVPIGNSPSEFRTFIEAELKRWAVAVKLSGAKVD
jgi:K(+)-stimulated pyrophosphate-energized sodium pump